MDKDLNPNVSIIMCAYNRAAFIGEAIQSVLAQAYQNWELLVLDDASTDSTREVVAEYSKQDSRIVYIHQPRNLGIARNRNYGLRLARGRYIAVLDSDDRWSSKDKLLMQIQALEEDPSCMAVGSFVKHIDTAGNTIKEIQYETQSSQIHQAMLWRNQLAHSAALFKKDKALAAGGYDTGLFIWEDYDLWLKLGKSGSLKNLPLFLVDYRIHGSQSDRRHKARAALEHLRIIRRYKSDYPGYWLALLKGVIRVTKAFLGL